MKTKRKNFTVSLPIAEYNALFKNADKIGISGASYGRKVLLEELKKKTILKRMT